MMLRLLLLTSWLLASAGFLLAQAGDVPGRDTYYQHERNEVSYYRDLASFSKPEPTLPEREQTDLVQPISLAGYFQAGDAYYLDTPEGLAQLVQLHRAINEETETMQGFRLMVYSGNSRNTALSIKSQLLAMNIDQKPYLDFDAPNFVVRLGDFMDRESARLFLREIEPQFPGAFIVPDKINIPKYEEPTETEEPEDPFAPVEDDQE